MQCSSREPAHSQGRVEKRSGTHWRCDLRFPLGAEVAFVCKWPFGSWLYRCSAACASLCRLPSPLATIHVQWEQGKSGRESTDCTQSAVLCVGVQAWTVDKCSAQRRIGPRLRVGQKDEDRKNEDETDSQRGNRKMETAKAETVRIRT